MLNYINTTAGQKKQWQGWHNTGRRDLIFIMVPYKGNALGLAISTAYNGSYMVVANNDSTLVWPDYKFPSSKSNCTILNKWLVISIMV